MWFFLRGDGQTPSNCPLSRRMLGVLLQRKRFEGLGNDFASASPASIDARMIRGFSGLILLVELRTNADFYVIAAPKECHGSPSFDEFGRRYEIQRHLYVGTSVQTGSSTRCRCP